MHVHHRPQQECECRCRALLVLPLHAEYGDHELLQQPVGDPGAAPGSAALMRAAPVDTPAHRAPWGIWVCAGTEREGVGFCSQDMVMLREWARLCEVPLQSAGLLDPH